MITVYATYRISDMVEGRGPMVIDKVFSTKKVANAYIDSQPGVMGISGKWSTEKYGDWTVKPLYVLDSIEDAEEAEAEARAHALSKLTDAERKLLGV